MRTSELVFHNSDLYPSLSNLGMETSLTANPDENDQQSLAQDTNDANAKIDGNARSSHIFLAVAMIILFVVVLGVS